MAGAKWFSSTGLLVLAIWLVVTWWQGNLPDKELLHAVLHYWSMPLAGLALLLASVITALQEWFRRSWVEEQIQRPDLDWRLQVELKQAQEAAAKLQEAQQQLRQWQETAQGLQQRLAALERLSERETAVSQMEAHAQAQLAAVEDRIDERLASAAAQAEQILITARHEAEALRAQAAAASQEITTKLAAWKRDVTHSQRAARQATDALRLMRKHVHCIQDELRWAKQEQRPICLPKIAKELRRLAQLAPVEAIDDTGSPY